MADRWTRIWWVRPVSSAAVIRVVGAGSVNRCSTRYRVRASLPRRDTAIRVGELTDRPMGASTTPDSPSTPPSTSPR